MDIAGLAVGVAALAGVLEDFVSILARIDAAKSMKKDYDTLVVKLDIQRALLHNLANEVRSPDPKEDDACVHGPNNEDLIIRSIECVRNLLEEGVRLQQRYGIKPANVQEALQSTQAPSNGSMSRVYRISQRFRFLRGVQPHKLRQPMQSSQHASQSHKDKHSGFQKLTWVTKDKERFQELEKNVVELIQLIMLLTHPTNSRPAHALQRSKSERPRSVRELEIIENPSSKKDYDIYSVTPPTNDPECAKRILDRLWFRFIEERKRYIKDPHFKTFEWAIRSPAPKTKWDDLRQWLQSGNDIYWISGKPGSGKSTLMKYLFGHPEVAELLEEWAGNQKLTMASFFLWNVGTSEQNTQHGLARGLLYHVLKENQSLIPLVLPDMWREAKKGSVDINPPSSAELDEAFQQLGKESTEGVFAFFIDGIDELKGDCREGISFIQELANSARIKILLSSREIEICDKAFKMKPKMRLQDLTKKDIEQYVDGTIRHHLSLSNTNRISERDIHQLVMSIQKKANGVFLWVVLACRTLRERFDVRDKVEELQKAIDELPPELEDLFRGILESVPPAYQQQAAKLLRICYVHASDVQMRRESLSALLLAWAYDKDMSLDKMEDFTRLSFDEKKQRCMTLDFQLRSRCRGLLEVHSSAFEGTWKFIADGTPRIEFMHRTVFEFLSSPAALEMDCLKIRDKEFDPVATLAYMHAYRMYNRDLPLMTGEEDLDILFASLRLVSRYSPSNLPRVLDRFVLGLMQPRDLYVGGITAQNNPFLPACLAGTADEKLESFFGCSTHELSKEHAALLLAVELHFYDFVKDFDVAGFNTLQISQHPDATERRNLLFHAIGQPMLLSICSCYETELFSSEMIENLLDSGCDPNQVIVRQEYEYEDWDLITTPWHEWISLLRHRFRIGGVNLIPKTSFVTAKMLEAGADLYPKIFTSHGDLRICLLEETLEWMEAAKKTELKQFRLQILESCLVICEAIESSLHENLITFKDEDQEKPQEFQIKMSKMCTVISEAIRSIVDKRREKDEE